MSLVVLDSPLPVLPQAKAIPVLLAVINPADLHLYPSGPFTRIAAQTANEAIQLVGRTRPQVVAIDWDLPSIDAAAICMAARAHAGILVTTAVPGHAPAALRAGCHSLLLKPVTPSLVATRMGRLVAELSHIPTNGSRPPKVQSIGTHRIWSDTECPQCGAPGATSFEFLSHRRAWYACLTCEHVWVGRRRECS